MDTGRLNMLQLSGDTSVVARISLLNRMGDLIVHPFGRGLGADTVGVAGADNGYLQMGLDLGLVGFILFLVLAFRLIRDSRRKMVAQPWRALAGPIAVFILFSEFSSPVLQSELGLLFWPLLGAMATAIDGEGIQDFRVENSSRRPRTKVPRNSSPRTGSDDMGV